MIGRNKRTITLYLGAPEGQAIMKQLVAGADVLIESFRPGTLERCNLGPDVLHAINPRLVVTRVTGFGQFGPYSGRPGFGTLAEAMSGFAAMTGEPDGPPTLPPFGLADGITALTTAAATMFALRAREQTGRGQVVDMAIIEPILTILGPQPLWYDQFGIVQERRGNRSVNNAPRNTYRTADDRWVAISTSAQSIAERVMQLVGHPEVIGEPWFKSGAERAKHADELDAMVGGWIARHPLDDVMREFEAAEAAVAPIYDIRHIMADPQFQALKTIVPVDDPELGPIKMQNVMFRMSETPGRIKWTGRKPGADNADVYGRMLGLDEPRMADLKARGVI
jgi:crotonobetainyl-CoA:carnitine CoA-transferase CaiB-like acyl-CoA transferase